MRRIVLGAALLALPVLSLVPAPAFAATNVICVGAGGAGCDQTVATIPLAITAANGNAVDDVIDVPAGNYTDGPYQLNGTTHAVTLDGVGPTTVITLLPSASQQVYLGLVHATASNLKIVLNATNSGGDLGLTLQDQSLIDNVTVDGTGTTQAGGATLDHSTVTNSAILLPPAGPSRAVFSSGGNSVTDTTLSGSAGYQFSADPGIEDTLSRVTIRSDNRGVWTDSGTINVDDSVIDLGTSSFGTGLYAGDNNPNTQPKAINANHVTILGGPDAIGASASAATPSVNQTATVNLTNSIVRGTGTSLFAEASNDGTPGINSNATLNVSYSDYHNTGGVVGAHGSGGVVRGAGNVDVDPKFVNAAGADYHLAPGSPVVDKGSSAAGPATDRDGLARVNDGDGNSSKIADMGAYERPTVPDTTPPATKVISHPAHTVTTSTVRFVFSSEAGARFQCRLDKGAFKGCASPRSIYVTRGRHTVAIRAVDPVGHVDPSPAVWSFQRVKPRHHHH